MKLESAPGATLLDLDHLQDLIPGHITTQGQLNEWEHANISAGESWAYARKHRDLISVPFIRLLNKRMFNQTWKWAGEFRTHQTNIGVEWHQVRTELMVLCDDLNYQIAHRIYPPDELAVRFHHRLVWIHPFPNGNGRHARLMANLLAIRLGYQPFSWGLSSKLEALSGAGELRSTYLTALRKADRGEVRRLVAPRVPQLVGKNT